MKTIFALALLMIGSMSYASSDKACQQEAQIIAKVTSVENREPMGCIVHVSPSSIQLYNESQACGLTLDEVLASGIEVGIVRGHDCEVDFGDVLTGILIKDTDGSIIIDKN